MNRNKPYLFQSFAIVVLSVFVFLVCKQFLPRKIFSEVNVPAKNMVIDSLAIEAIQAMDTTAVTVAVEDTLPDKKVVFKKKKGIQFPTEQFEAYSGYQHLMAFYEKLLNLEKTGEGNVRIAYFGDSMTDGDLIVKDLRDKLQQRFGGAGVGFVNITSESASARATVRHQFSDNWKTISFLTTKKPESPFGITGQVFFTEPDTINPAWVQYKSSRYNKQSVLNKPKLFYGKSNNKHGKVTFITGNDTIYKKLVPKNTVNTLTVAPYDLKELKAAFTATDSIPIYGFNFDDGKGVHVDNFSSRGNSGLPLSIFNVNLMQAFNKELHYDLIVLQYGANVLNYGSYNYRWYEKRMKRVVNHLKQCFPDVAILIVSTADKATKYNMEMKTDSAVVPLALSQKRYAVQSDAAFINLYMLMGGNGSMVKWVETEPALAGKDYTHFNYRGSQKIGSLIYKQINKGYEQYKEMNDVIADSIPETLPVIIEQDSITTKTDSIYAE
ncbi:hypothetical protein [Flavobacterium litorale]|uniref:SGNH hydrolase-type esterase domain-containing protein n=1 Tax=Flavobacterium litorale TaxID=2856519 RepID=A0ABX8V8J0_9FLAO|nr:hypothetical protein [Flavobacterium litorale]QYJ67356.1 hypothetical protein K1I41_07195 [Flavobacterium litorale]